MFGYVKAYKPELKVRDYEQYKAVYCSLCKTLGREYGLFARLTLSYDFTFAALLRLALSGECPGFHKSRCPFNPFAKCNACSGGESDFSFTAAAAVIMMFISLLRQPAGLRILETPCLPAFVSLCCACA